MKRTINQTAKHSLKTKKAFTLVELLVVIAIIGILFVVLISKVDFATDKAKTAGVQTDFRSYQMAMKMVGMEQQGFTNDMNKLAAQLNKNLDPKLQVAVESGNLVTDAKDPWGTEYQFTYGEPANTRGEIVVRSAGPDLTYNTDDDIIIVSRYEFGVNGGGVVEATESINPLVLYATPGLYDPDTGEMTKTWDKLIDDGDITLSETSIVSANPSMAGVLSIGNSVETIVSGAFYAHNSLTSVIIPDSVTRMEDGVFYGCESLASVILPNGLTVVMENTFRNCSSLEIINISNSITAIDGSAFYDCTSLTSVTVMSTTPPTLDNNVFSGCDALTRIFVPASSIDAYKAAAGWSEYASLITPIQ